jgi:tRNA acetyltransferase TAN1
MSESKRKSEGGDSNRKKKKYRSVRTAISLSRSNPDDFTKDGTPVWGKRHVDGPGVWVSCASVYLIGKPLLTFYL